MTVPQDVQIFDQICNNICLFHNNTPSISCHGSKNAEQSTAGSDVTTNSKEKGKAVAYASHYKTIGSAGDINNATRYQTKDKA